MMSPPPPQHQSLSRPNSAPLGASPLAPSLPISRDGTANRLRQKLVSPPPPVSDEPQSPILSLRMPLHASPSGQLSAPASPAIGSVLSMAAPLARPVAVRKPLTFGFDKDEQRENELGARLQVPPIIYVSSLPRQQGEEPQEPDAKPAVLDWKEDADESTSPSSSGDMDDDEEEGEEWSSYEEDLHGECTCLDCEQKMVAALSPGYQPQWTRGARRKYLADRKEAQNEQSRKAVRPPIWLSCEDSETAAASSPLSESMALPLSPSSKVRDVCADEADGRKGIVRRESVPRKEGADSADGVGPGPDAKETDADDLTMRKEVEKEIRLREEEHRLKRTRSEMRKLSGDSGSGLRVAGGGARAMMRQLEEAEQAERRARFERSRSPKYLEEQALEDVKAIGAVGEAPVKPFTPPPRLSSANVEDTSKPSAAALAIVKEKPSRTPSPLKRALSLGKGGDGKAAATAPVTSAAKLAASVEPIGRHPSPSLLIRRELALGIPVQSTTGGNARARQSWHNSPKSASPALESVKSSLNSTPSPRLNPSSGTGTVRLDGGMDGVRVDGGGAKELVELPGKGMVRSYSMQPSSSGTSTAHRSVSDDQDRTGSGSSAEGTAASPSGTLRRSNTTGSRGGAAAASKTGAETHAPTHQRSVSQTPTSALSSGMSTPNMVEARLDKAKAKARSSFRDLVARIKS